MRTAINFSFLDQRSKSNVTSAHHIYIFCQIISVSDRYFCRSFFARTHTAWTDAAKNNRPTCFSSMTGAQVTIRMESIQLLKETLSALETVNNRWRAGDITVTYYAFPRWRFYRNFVSKFCNFVTVGQIIEKSHRPQIESILHTVVMFQLPPDRKSERECR